MPSIKLTKNVVDTAKPAARDYEIRDTIVPGFMCKITPAGRKTFMLSYRTPTGERRKPALGTYGQITVDQARKLAQDFLASVRGGGDPGGGPPFYKFGKFVRYAVTDLQAWAAERRHERTAGENARVY